MIIKTERKGDKLVITHYEDTSCVEESVKYLRDKNHWFNGKDYLHVARIPAIDYFNMIQAYPEIVQGDTDTRSKALKKALNSERFSIWRFHKL